jgi:hypothetical protein
MPQVSEFDPVTVFGDVPPSPRAAAKPASRSTPGGIALTPSARHDESVALRISIAERLRNVVWWRVALGILVIAVWIASAVNASAASVALSTHTSEHHVIAVVPHQAAPTDICA